MTQPALTRSIQALELEVGVDLVERRGRGSVLTEAGKLLVERARRLLQEEAEAYRALQLLQTGDIGHVRVGVSAGIHALAVPRFIEALAATRPRVRTEIVVDDTAALCRRLHDETLDIVAGDADALVGDPQLEVETLEPARVGFFVRPGHPLLDADTLDPDALMRYPMGSLPFTEALTRRLVQAMGREWNADQLVTISCTDIRLLREVAQRTELVVACLALHTAHDVAEGRLVRLPFTGLEARVGIARRPGAAGGPTLTLFRDCVSSAVDEARALLT
jgi:DNA-binding transcriptional LysR family regulator